MANFGVNPNHDKQLNVYWNQCEVPCYWQCRIPGKRKSDKELLSLFEGVVENYDTILLAGLEMILARISKDVYRIAREHKKNVGLVTSGLFQDTLEICNHLDYVAVSVRPDNLSAAKLFIERNSNTIALFSLIHGQNDFIARAIKEMPAWMHCLGNIVPNRGMKPMSQNELNELDSRLENVEYNFSSYGHQYEASALKNKVNREAGVDYILPTGELKTGNPIKDIQV